MGKRKSKRAPTNGHVELPWFYFLLFALMAVLSAGLFALSVYSAMPHPKPEDLGVYAVRFRDYEVKLMPKSTSTSLRLYGEDDPRPFTLDFFEGFDEWIPDPARLCDGENYQVEARECPEFFDIYTITASDGTPVLTYENCLQGYQNSQGTAILVLRVASVVFFVFFVTGIVFTRHPEKFPAWVEKLYYKRDFHR